MKILKCLIVMLSIIVLKTNVYATNMSINLDCPDTAYSGDIVTCSIYTNVDGYKIKSIKADYLFNKVAYQKFNPNSVFKIDTNNSNYFSINNIDGVESGIIGNLTILINGKSKDTVSVGLNNIDVIDINDSKVTCNNITETINVLTKTVPTTKKHKKILYLDDLKVDGYDINFDRNVFNYTIDVGYEVNSINVSASTNNYKVTGVGKIHLNEGINDINIRVFDDDTESTNYTIKVNRVIKTSNIVNNNYDEIKEAFKSNKELIINLDKSDNLIVTKDVINLILNRNRKLIYNILDGKDILYTYIFDGNKIDDYDNNLDLSIKFNKSNEIINSNINDSKLIYFINNYNGYFPKGTILKIKNINEYHSESRLSLYKLNNTDLELVDSRIRIKDNFIEINIDKGDNYVISNSMLKSNILTLVIYVIILFGILIIVYIIYKMFKKNKQVKVPKLNDYMDNPNFKDNESVK